MNRRDKINYYLDLAEVVSRRSTCLRRHFGAVIVNNDQVISTGYVGVPRGRANCSDIGECVRMKLGVPRGERYELCRSVHAEANAIIAAPRDQMLGSTLYLSCIDSKSGELVPQTSSCMMCKKLVINAGVERVVIRDTKDEYREIDVSDWIENDDSLSGDFGY